MHCGGVPGTVGVGNAQRLADSDPRVRGVGSRVCAAGAGELCFVHPGGRGVLPGARCVGPGAGRAAPGARGVGPGLWRESPGVWNKDPGLAQGGVWGADVVRPRVSAAYEARITMSIRFLPTQEAVLDNWLANFSAKMSAGPATYGLSSGDAAEIKAAVDSWHAAFETALAPSTRTMPSVAEKRVQKKNVVRVVRSFAARVRSNGTVSDELKIHLGLRLRAPAGSPVPPPPTAPTLTVRRIDMGSHQMWAADIEAAPRRGKPAWAAGLMVFRAVGEEPTHRPQDAAFLTLVTKTSFVSTFAHADSGKTASYFARWINAKGELGPWSTASIAAIAA